MYKVLLKIPVLIYLGLLSPAVAELIICDTDHTVYEAWNVYYLTLYRKKFGNS